MVSSVISPLSNAGSFPVILVRNSEYIWVISG